MHDHHVNSALSALVMLGAVALTYTTYSSYKAEVAIEQQLQSAAAMDQAANAFLSFKIERAAQVAGMSTSTVEEVGAGIKAE